MVKLDISSSKVSIFLDLGLIALNLVSWKNSEMPLMKSMCLFTHLGTETVPKCLIAIYMKWLFLRRDCLCTLLDFLWENLWNSHSKIFSASFTVVVTRMELPKIFLATWYPEIHSNTLEMSKRFQIFTYILLHGNHGTWPFHWSPQCLSIDHSSEFGLETAPTNLSSFSTLHCLRIMLNVMNSSGSARFSPRIS